MHRAKGDRLVCASVLPVCDNGCKCNFLAFLKLLEIHAEQKIRERLYFVLRCFFFILLKTNKRYGVEASIRCDLLMQQPMHGTCLAYWRCYGISLLSKSAAIPPEVQH